MIVVDLSKPRVVSAHVGELIEIQSHAHTSDPLQFALCLQSLVPKNF